MSMDGKDVLSAPIFQRLSPAEGRQGASIPSQYPALFYGVGEICVLDGVVFRSLMLQD